MAPPSTFQSLFLFSSTSSFYPHYCCFIWPSCAVSFQNLSMTQFRQLVSFFSRHSLLLLVTPPPPFPSPLPFTIITTTVPPCHITAWRICRPRLPPHPFSPPSSLAHCALFLLLSLSLFLLFSPPSPPLCLPPSLPVSFPTPRLFEVVAWLLVCPREKYLPITVGQLFQSAQPSGNVTIARALLVRPRSDPGTLRAHWLFKSWVGREEEWGWHCVNWVCSRVRVRCSQGNYSQHCPCSE